MQLSIDTRRTIEGIGLGESDNPFAAVIAEYQAHGDKAVKRDVAEKSTRRTKAALYYFDQVVTLKKLAEQ